MEDEDPDEMKVFSDDPAEMCRYVCNLCQEETKLLRAHVSKSHGISIVQMREGYPEVIYSHKRYHRYSAQFFCSYTVSVSHSLFLYFKFNR